MAEPRSFFNYLYRSISEKVHEHGHGPGIDRQAGRDVHTFREHEIKPVRGLACFYEVVFKCPPIVRAASSAGSSRSYAAVFVPDSGAYRLSEI